MKHFAYRVYRNQVNNSLFSGTVSAIGMDAAVVKVIATCKIEVVHEINPFSLTQTSNFILEGQKVGILIYARPEDY